MATKTKLTPEQVKQFAAIRSEIARLKAKNEQLRQRVTAKKAQKSSSASARGGSGFGSFFSANRTIGAEAQRILNEELPTLLRLSPSLQKEAERLQIEIERVKSENPFVASSPPNSGDAQLQLATKRFVEEAIRVHNTRNAEPPPIPAPSKGIVGQSWKTPKGEYTIIQSNEDRKSVV